MKNYFVLVSMAVIVSACGPDFCFKFNCENPHVEQRQLRLLPSEMEFVIEVTRPVTEVTVPNLAGRYVLQLEVNSATTPEKIYSGRLYVGSVGSNCGLDANAYGEVDIEDGRPPDISGAICRVGERCPVVGYTLAATMEIERFSCRTNSVVFFSGLSQESKSTLWISNDLSEAQYVADLTHAPDADVRLREVNLQGLIEVRDGQQIDTNAYYTVVTVSAD